MAMENFTPFASLFGGMLIGLSAVALLLLNGRIAGVSGVTAGLLSFSTRATDRGWRIAFVVGIAVAPLLLMSISGERPDIAFVAPLPLMLVAGVLVGFGTVLGNGCTSGHGICGIARLSPRSFIATAVFMAAGIASTFVAHHLFGGG